MIPTQKEFPASLLFGLEPSVRESTCYEGYGLVIESEVALPEFKRVAVARKADVRVSFSSGGAWIPAVRTQNSSWQVNLRRSRFWFKGVGGFEIVAGSQILISPEPGIDDALLRMYVEGMMMATVLYQRRFFVLHASVIKIDDKCIALLGHVGAGKSSTAAALHARGHAVVSDDNAAIVIKDGIPYVTPAFPFVKIFPAIAESLGHSVDSLERMHPLQPKFVSPVSANFPALPVPLSHIYTLSRVADHTTAKLSPSQTIIELVCNSVPTRWKLSGDAHHLAQCAKLASCVSAFRIRTFEKLEELPRLAETVERHCGERHV